MTGLEEGVSVVLQQTHLPPRLLSGALCGLFVLLWLAGVTLRLDGGTRGVPLLSTLVCGYALVGTLVAIREPRNAVGWLMVTIASLIAVKDLVDLTSSDGDRLVAGLVMTSGVYVAVLALLVLFPDGRPSSRFRPVVW